MVVRSAKNVRNVESRKIERTARIGSTGTA
jgi:hypothetical protein